MLARRSSRPLAAILGRRAMGTVAKGTNRAAMHGSRSPTVEGREEAEAAIERGKEEKQKAREEVEGKVGDGDAQIGSSPAPPAHDKSAK